jgi:hypothetical protein
MTKKDIFIIINNNNNNNNYYNNFEFKATSFMSLRYMRMEVYVKLMR